MTFALTSYCVLGRPLCDLPEVETPPAASGLRSVPDTPPEPVPSYRAVPTPFDKHPTAQIAFPTRPAIAFPPIARRPVSGCRSPCHTPAGHGPQAVHTSPPPFRPPEASLDQRSFLRRHRSGEIAAPCSA